MTADAKTRKQAGIIKPSPRFAALGELGSLENAYHTHWESTTGRFLVALFFMIAPVVYALFLVGTERNAGARSLFVMIASPIVAAWALYSGLRNLICRQVMLLFADAIVRIRFGRVHVFRWDELAGIFEIASGTFFVRDNAARKATFHDFSPAQQDKLRKRIGQELWQRKLPLALQQYKEGGLVDFGKLRLSQTGLTLKGRTLPWDKIAWLRIDHGVLRIGARSKLLLWGSVPMAKLPNYHIFKNLVERHVVITEGPA